MNSHDRHICAAPLRPLHFNLLAPLLGGILLLTGCATENATTTNDGAAVGAAPGALDEPTAMLLEGERVALLWVNGMGCPLCANNVELQLRRLDGVERVSVNLGTGLITAHLNADARPTRDELERAVTNSGFTLVRAEVSP